SRIVSPSSLRAFERREQLVDRERGKAERELADDHDFRVDHEAARDREHLLLAARECPSALPPALLEARKERIHPLQAVGIASRRSFGVGAHLRFSATDMALKSCRPSGTWTRPRAALPCGARRVTSSRRTGPGRPTGGC